MKKIIAIAMICLLVTSIQAAVTNIYEKQINSAFLSFQPVPDDLWQSYHTTNYVVKGALHAVVPDGTLSLYDSTAVGDFGDLNHGFAGQGCCLFQDGISPDNDVTIHIDFDLPTVVTSIQVFSLWGDNRQFSYFDAYGSASGTNDDTDYTYIGALVDGAFGETNDPPNQTYYRAARLYDTSGMPLMSNVVSIKLVQRNVGYGIGTGYGEMLPPGTPQGSYTSIAGSSENEIDIMGFFIIVPSTPAVDITNQNASVYSNVTDIGGTNANVVGTMTWTNSNTGAGGGFPAASSWIISDVALGAGPNTITVRGTNIDGLVALDTVTITRIIPNMPFVDITTEPTIVNYDVSDYSISGSNNVNVVGSMTWSNLLTEAIGSFPAASDWVASNIPLGVGINVITISGTNNAGVVASDMVTFSRLPAGVTNLYETQTDSANLTFQPVPDDLWQDPGTTNFIVKGTLHAVMPDGTLSLYDSPSVGDFGNHGFSAGSCLFSDGISPDADVVIHVDFASQTRVDEIHIFSFWGDSRQFSYFDAYGSTAGTNDNDYSYLGTLVNSAFGETNDPPTESHYRASKLYNVNGDPLMNDVVSIKLVQKNVGYTTIYSEYIMEAPGTPLGDYDSISGSSEKEIDIIGEVVPEPALLINILILAFAFLRRK